MTSRATRPSAPDPETGGRSFSAALINGLIASAVLLALLPIPVTALRLLPVYQVHAHFLIFYTPLVCLLALAYLLYVRDTLGRWMFATILNPLPDFDPYSGPSARGRLLRIFRALRISLLAILPVALVALSFYCFTRYTARFTASVEIAATLAQSPSIPQPLAPNDSVPPQKSRGKTRAGAARKISPDTARVVDSVALRREVLQTARIDRIPLFTELTTWYIGIFATAVVAVLLMALKENAKVAMGLSEQDIILGPPGNVAAEEYQ